MITGKGPGPSMAIGLTRSRVSGLLTARCKDMGNTLCIDMGNSFHFTFAAFHEHVVERNLLCSTAADLCEVGFEGPQRHVAIVSEVRNQSQERLQVEGTVRTGGSARFARSEPSSTSFAW